jgi:WD40 repeat protein
MLASASAADTTIKLWDIRTETPTLKKTLIGHSMNVQGLVFNHDGSILASASEDRTVKLWNTTTFELIETLTGHSSWVYDVSFNQDGRILASASEDRTVKLWNTTTFELINTYTGHTERVLRVMFNRDGLLASASNDRKVKLWDNIEGEMNNVDLTNKNGVIKFLENNIIDLFEKYRQTDGTIPTGNAYQVHTKTEKYDYLNLSKNLYLYLKKKIQIIN